MRYFLELSYRGTAYNGWQRQPDAPSVQAAVEQALSTLLRDNVEVTGAGRTDTGVHAVHYIAHFDASAIDTPRDFCYHLNALLPDDIAVSGVRAVRNDAHARFDAQLREYQYYIIDHKDPFRRGTTWQYYQSLDFDAMNRAAARMLAFDDFTTFSKLHSGNKTTICCVSVSEWRREDDELIYTIAADRFLRNMVRATVGTLIDVGRGKLTVDQFDNALRSLDRSRAGGSAPAGGLFLTRIVYDERIYL